MHIPIYLKKQLTTPEALRFEQTRRVLKQAVADAKRESAQCVKPFKHPTVLTPEQERDWVIYRQFKEGKVAFDALGKSLSNIRPDIKNQDLRDAEIATRYDLTLAYQDALIAHPAKLAALRLAEQAARIAYTTHLNTEP